MPDRGREPWRPVDSGNRDSNRIPNERRLNRAAIRRPSEGHAPTGALVVARRRCHARRTAGEVRVLDEAGFGGMRGVGDYEEYGERRAAITELATPWRLHLAPLLCAGQFTAKSGGVDASKTLRRGIGRRDKGPEPWI